jgi:cysteinyl-tRNA synthetase
MIDLTETLVEREHAYPRDGNVYFEVSTFPPYGRLSGNSVEDLIAGARVEVGEGKRSPADFALWKRADPDKIMRWESPWGEGVPGWHLECSAMAINLLGEEIDIHTGGEDHVFPHHEDEIAQSEGATGKTFARYWMHNAFLQLPGEEKMSKSLGNIFTVSDLQERGIHPLSFRYFTFQAHYRTPLSFTWEALEAAQTALYRVYEAAAELVQAADPAPEISGEAEAHRSSFHEAINRDLDLPGAVATLHGVLGSALEPADKQRLLEDFDQVLGLDILQIAHSLGDVSEDERTLLDRRAEARASRDWAASDELRSRLAARGLDVKDTASGQRWLRRDVLPRSRGQDA